MTDRVCTLDEWDVCSGSADPFCPPEVAGIAVRGIVYGHPRKPDGDRIRTSRVVALLGPRKFRTETGTMYELLRPNEGYLAWLREHRPNWDPENPITVLGVQT